ncbi:helix-turn-helix domain-containing protein [Collimonas sp.]|jgi:AraC family transcriptional activator of pobA|uniref:helix-turn-helix domain-containing protein n=1 Tax=Collimonas sp. TaxID=1963772 RepID=UPI002CEBB69A|nr:helix-turn-helix domain-containing protein [Collimonas sp.]HWW06004.1 helix-turn-helix domain-containing protein [Collimonas sp.]
MSARHAIKKVNKKAIKREIPQFALYGENTAPENAEFVHIELIETRSRLHDWHIQSHTHRGLFQILFLFGGHVRAEIDSGLWECEGPVALTIHPSVVHGFDFSKEAQGFVLTVDQSLLFGDKPGVDAALFSTIFVEPLAIDLTAVDESRQRIEALLKQLLTESSWPRAGHTLMLEWLARSVLLLLVRLHSDQRSADRTGRHDFELFSRFRVLVEEHYNEQWQVGRFAQQLRVTESRLNRLCIRLTGKSAFDMMQHRLMLEARRKLTYLPSAVASIAYELGFQDPAYFSRTFKRHTGLTPKEFRQQTTSEGNEF